jgi:hypothetical protein
MRAVIRLLFLCLIVASVGFGGLRQATTASWSGIGGETLVSPSPRCDSTSPDRPHAPIHLCLLKHCCVLSSSSGDAGSKVLLTAVVLVLAPRSDAPPPFWIEQRDIAPSTAQWPHNRLSRAPPSLLS